MAETGLLQGRSPRYPRSPLMTAVGYARCLYDGAHRSVVDTLAAYRVMGFAGKSGASSMALGAARQYGLLESARHGVRVSELGLRILQPSSDDELAYALHEAAFSPPVFAQLREHFGEIPRSDEPIKSYLIRSLDFSKSGADDCLTALRETLKGLPELSKKPAAGSTQVQKINEEDRISPRAVAAPDVPNYSVSPSSVDGNVRIPLTRDCTAELSFSGPLSAVALDRLIKHIELMKEVWTAG